MTAIPEENPLRQFGEAVWALHEDQYRRDMNRRLAPSQKSRYRHALLWVTVAAITLYGTDFMDIIVANPLILRGWLRISAWSFAGAIGLGMYALLWLRGVRGLEIDGGVDVSAPWLYPSAAFLFMVYTVSLMVAVYPVFGASTFIIIPVINMGLIFSTVFFP